MSETVHYKGTLKIIEKWKGEDLEAQCKRLLGNRKLESYYDSYKEMLKDELYKEYIIRDNMVYSIEKEDIDPDSDIFKINKNANGDFSFEVRYYNGGCGFDEAIEEAFENYERENNTEKR